MSRVFAPVRETSIEAYERIRKTGTLGDMQRQVLLTIARFPNRTDREIARIMAGAALYDPNRVRPRRVELLKRGYIEVAGKRICSVSGATAYTWRIKTHHDQGELF